VSSGLVIEQLRVEHLAELATQLRHPEVYEHIGAVPSLQDFIRDRERALRGPGAEAGGERWLNFLVREPASTLMLGRLEATLHDDIAEVAFLFSPRHWGKGLAFEALAWLHAEIQDTHGISSFWATTVAANARCRSLLLRSGYQPVQAGAPVLYSFDPGDLVFQLRAATRRSSAAPSAA
jgi:RimJ/RimL family protein N-acetyltransferase